MKKKLFVAAALLAAMGASGKGRDAAPKRIADSDGIVRIEVLACRSIREKLLCFFEQLADEHGSRTFPLPFSLSMLADYISADRSAMMREMRKMREEDLISTEGRSVTLL